MSPKLHRFAMQIPEIESARRAARRDQIIYRKTSRRIPRARATVYTNFCVLSALPFRDFCQEANRFRKVLLRRPASSSSSSSSSLTTTTTLELSLTASYYLQVTTSESGGNLPMFEHIMGELGKSIRRNRRKEIISVAVKLARLPFEASYVHFRPI